MVRNNRPTKSQIGELIRDYEGVIYDEIDYTKATGANPLNMALRSLISDDIVRTEVNRLASTIDRKQFSDVISSYYKSSTIEAGIQLRLNHYLKQYGQELDFEAMRKRRNKSIESETVHAVKK